MPPFLGLRTVIYHVSDLAAAKEWYRKATGVDPYFDQPYYVGFSVGGFELGLDPDPASGTAGVGGHDAYWGVASAADTFAHLLSIGGTPKQQVTDVGEGIRIASVLDPFGNAVCIIENPHFGKE